MSYVMPMSHRCNFAVVLGGRNMSSVALKLISLCSAVVDNKQLFPLKVVRERREGVKKNQKARCYKYDCQLIVYKDISAIVS